MDYIVKAYKDWKLHSQFHEIVPDMDDDFMFNEKQSIRDSARSLKKYGSTCCNHIRNNETLVRHYVEKTDTLQGIALKYGCTTEQIRRANRLFASDSLFLRQFLLVPVDKNSPYFPQETSNELSTNSTLSPISDMMQNEQNSISSTTSSSSSSTTNSNSSSDTSGSSETLPSPTKINQNTSPRSSNLPTRPYSIAGELLIQSNDDDPAALNHHNHNNGSSSSTNKQSKSLDSVAAMTPEDENRKCINDFLNKIDTTISESRKYVEKSKEMLKSQSDDDLFVVNTDTVEQKRNNHLNSSYKNNNNNNNNNNNRQLYGNHQRHSSNGSGTSDTAHLLNTTQLRRVQNSLKRLEKQQDEFFEL